MGEDRRFRALDKTTETTQSKTMEERFKQDLTRVEETTITRAEGERSFRLSFSSETPILRWGEIEYLDHDDGAIDLSRLEQMGVVLFNHDRDAVIGRVASASIEGRRGIAMIQFDEDDESQRIAQKVESGTLRGVSVGYRVLAVEHVEAGGLSADGRFAGPAYIARKWEPLEISIVSIPADSTVGVGRSIKDHDLSEEVTTTMGGVNREPAAAVERARDAETTSAAETQVRAAADTQAEAQTAVSVDTDAIRREAQEAERTRVNEITEACRAADMDPTKLIRDGSSVDDAMRAINKHLISTRPPVGVAVGRDEGDKLIAAASDALLLRAGLRVEKPEDGARELRHLTLRDLAIDSLQRAGINGIGRMDNDRLLGELLRQFFTPTAAFPAILDQTVDKAYRAGYAQTPTTFERWTARGTLSDFKTSKSGYIAGAAGEFLLVPEGGEIKHDIPVDHPRPGRKLETYGRQFTLTRQAFINDDIGMVTSLPARYAAAARRTINKQVYSVLTGNAVIYDGEQLFSTEHGNDAATAAPTIAVIQAMIKTFMLAKDDDGNPISVSPRYILAPVGLDMVLKQLIGTATIAVNDNGVITTQHNPLSNLGIEIISDPFLNTLADDKGWYMFADPNIMPVIQVDYLNGTEVPTIRRMEHPGQLGFVWDMYFDWGVSVMEYRGTVRNQGV